MKYQLIFLLCLIVSIQRYAVAPLSTNSGLIGWVPHCDTLHTLIRDYREKKKILLNIEHRIMLRVCFMLFHILKPGKSRKFSRFVGFWNKNTLPISKTKMLIRQSKANLDVNIYFVESLIFYTQGLGKYWQGVRIGVRITHSILLHDLLASKLEFYFLK